MPASTGCHFYSRFQRNLKINVDVLVNFCMCVYTTLTLEQVFHQKMKVSGFLPFEEEAGKI